jgi:hypothetical protein
MAKPSLLKSLRPPAYCIKAFYQGDVMPSSTHPQSRRNAAEASANNKRMCCIIRCIKSAHVIHGKLHSPQ